jgi:hypothetical protein
MKLLVEPDGSSGRDETCGGARHARRAAVKLAAGIRHAGRAVTKLVAKSGTLFGP